MINAVLLWAHVVHPILPVPVVRIGVMLKENLVFPGRASFRQPIYISLHKDLFFEKSETSYEEESSSPPLCEINRHVLSTTAPSAWREIHSEYSLCSFLQGATECLLLLIVWELRVPFEKMLYLFT